MILKLPVPDGFEPLNAMVKFSLRTQSSHFIDDGVEDALVSEIRLSLGSTTLENHRFFADHDLKKASPAVLVPSRHLYSKNAYGQPDQEISKMHSIIARWSERVPRKSFIEIDSIWHTQQFDRGCKVFWYATASDRSPSLSLLW